MEEKKKKPIMIGIIVACLAAAAVITYKSSTGGPRGYEALDPREKMWVMCSNPDCESKYEIAKKDYYKYVEENLMGTATPPLVCEECSEKSVYRAVKCQCGATFFWRTGTGDYEDRCSECGYSQIEEDRKAAAAQRK